MLAVTEAVSNVDTVVVGDDSIDSEPAVVTLPLCVYVGRIELGANGRFAEGWQDDCELVELWRSLSGS